MFSPTLPFKTPAERFQEAISSWNKMLDETMTPGLHVLGASKEKNSTSFSAKHGFKMCIISNGESIGVPVRYDGANGVLATLQDGALTLKIDGGESFVAAEGIKNNCKVQLWELPEGTSNENLLDISVAKDTQNLLQETILVPSATEETPSVTQTETTNNPNVGPQAVSPWMKIFIDPDRWLALTGSQKQNEALTETFSKFDILKEPTLEEAFCGIGTSLKRGRIIHDKPGDKRLIALVIHSSDQDGVKFALPYLVMPVAGQPGTYKIIDPVWDKEALLMCTQLIGQILSDEGFISDQTAIWMGAVPVSKRRQDALVAGNFRSAPTAPSDMPAQG